VSTDVVEVIVAPATVVEVDATPVTVVQVATAVGPPGPPGVAGPSNGFAYTQVAPAASWTVAHALGRIPTVTLYSVTGELVDTDITASTTAVTVSFPTPTAGTLVLT